MPAAGAAGNNSNVTMDPLLRVSVAALTGFTSPGMTFWPLAECGAGLSSDFLLFLPVLLPRQRLEIGR